MSLVISRFIPERHVVEDEGIVSELKNALAEFNHEFETVFLNNDTSKPGFLVRFDEWRLADAPDARR